MNEHYFKETKGQSAIEYLMTYGWMLLVVAIVGGAIFATVQGQCAQSTSGFSGGDAIVENFGLDGSGGIQMEVRNGGADTLTIEEATLIDNGDELGISPDEDQVSDNWDETEEELTISVGDSETLVIGEGELESSDGCNDFDLEFVYESGDLTGQQVSGSLTDSITFDLA